MEKVNWTNMSYDRRIGWDGDGIEPKDMLSDRRIGWNGEGEPKYIKW